MLERSRGVGVLALAVVGAGGAALVGFVWLASDGSAAALSLSVGAAAVTLALWLGLIRQLRSDLRVLNSGVMQPGLDRDRPRRALLVYYSLSGNGGKAIARVARGLMDAGYQCHDCPVRPRQPERFQFPFASFGQFFRIMIGALLRWPTEVEWCISPRDRDGVDGADAAGDAGDAGAVEPDDHDLVVCLSQTWMLGISAPMQGLFESEQGRALFAGRDVAVINVCRGLWRRSQAQLATWCVRAGGHVIATSPHSNPGTEPMRLFSLVVFLALGPDRWPGHREGRWLTRQFLSERDLDLLHALGRQLAGRPRHDEPAVNWKSVAARSGDPGEETP